MISIFYKVPVDSTSQALWNILLDKVNNPEKYVTGVGDVKFTETADSRKLRVMDRHDTQVKEIIDVDEKEMTTRFELKDHPRYEGFIFSGVENDDDDCFLLYELQWNSREGKGDFQEVKSWLDKAVYGTKKAAERI